MSHYVQNILPFVQDKVVEVYTGGTAKDRKYADYTVSYKEVIKGKVLSGQEDLLVLEVSDGDGNFNTVYINAWAIVAIIEPKNKISMFDIYIEESQKQVK